MNSASVRERSLAHHLALAACRRGNVNRSLLNELMRTAYLHGSYSGRGLQFKG
jgi:hypothetical protein